MRILQATADWKWTGPAEPMLHAVAGLRARGHHVDLACPEPPPEASGSLLERAMERGLEPRLRLHRRQGYWPLRDAAEVRRLRALLERSSYDVVHVHHTRDHLLARRALVGSRTRLVASWHRGEPIAANPWSRWLYGPRRLSGLVVLSESLARAAERRLRFPPVRIAVVPGCVDSERFAPSDPQPALRAELALAPDDRVIGVVARLQPHRRFELLLEAFRRARERAPALRLLVIGRGTRAESVLEEPVRRLGLEPAVIRAGYRRDDYRDVLALMDALVFLVPGSDGSCRAVLEAMSMAVPTISSRRGILPELVADGETGRLVDETPESIADAFADLARDPPAWRARGQAAHKRALEHHPIERAAATLEALYRRLR